MRHGAGHAEPLKRSAHVLDRYSGCARADEPAVEPLVARAGREPPEPVMLNYRGPAAEYAARPLPDDVPRGEGPAHHPIRLNPGQ
jgi:hypothetical protein